MSAEQTPDIERVLAEHTYMLQMSKGAICLCGFVPTVDADSLATQQDYHRAHVAQALAPVLAAAVRDAEQRAEIAGQMKHITAEMVRGDQPLDEKEEQIADLRARLSHAEAKAAGGAHECKTGPLCDGWPFGVDDAYRTIAAVAWPAEREENRDGWAVTMRNRPDLFEQEAVRARERLEAAIAHGRAAIVRADRVAEPQYEAAALSHSAEDSSNDERTEAMSAYCPEGVGTCTDADAGPCVVGYPCALHPMTEVRDDTPMHFGYLSECPDGPECERPGCLQAHVAEPQHEREDKMRAALFCVCPEPEPWQNTDRCAHCGRAGAPTVLRLLDLEPDSWTTNPRARLVGDFTQADWTEEDQ